MKPDDKEKYQVVVAVNLPDLWGSQIIVFKGDAHFKNFFYRNDDDQKWFRLSDDRNIQREWGLHVTNELQTSRFKEVISDEDGCHYEGEIWFIGELK